MKIAIAGGSGFIGKAMCSAFIAQQYEVYILTRQPEQLHKEAGATYVRWLHEGDHPENELEGVDAIINLAGLSLSSGRWTAARKARILESRSTTTQEIIRIINAMKQKPAVLLNASAVGYYGISRDHQFTEQDIVPPSDFLATVVNSWEQEALKSGIRTVLMRLGVVLGAGEGAFAKMLLPYKLYVGGRLGSGDQPLPWIHIDDVVQAAQYCMETPEIEGAVNFVAPQLVTMEQFGRVVAKQLNRPHYFPVPSMLLRLMLGEMSMLLLEGQQVVPQKLQDHRYTFRYPELTDAIKSIIAR